MRIAKLIVAITWFALGCGATDPRIQSVERGIARSEQTLASVDECYDLSERDIARIRADVFALVDRGRIVSEQLELAAREYEYAAMYNHLASDEFARAAQNYAIAAAEYEKIASLILRAASSKRLLRGLCGRAANMEGLGAFGMEGAGGSEEVPLSVMKSLAERAARMLLCER